MSSQAKGKENRQEHDHQGKHDPRGGPHQGRQKNHDQPHHDGHHHLHVNLRRAGKGVVRRHNAVDPVLDLRMRLTFLSDQPFDGGMDVAGYVRVLLQRGKEYPGIDLGHPAVRRQKEPIHQRLIQGNLFLNAELCVAERQAGDQVIDDQVILAHLRVLIVCQ